MDDQKKKKTKTSKKQTKKETIPETDQNDQPALQPAGQQAVNPAFEQAAQVVVPLKENRGGLRDPVGGRPLGLTDEKAKVKNLPQYPSTPIKHSLEGLFSLWALAIKIEEVELTEEESFSWSLSLTQLQEFYYPGMIPEIAEAWASFVFGSILIVNKRFKIISKTLKQRQAAGDTKHEPAGENRHFKESFGLPYHAITPGEVVTFTNIVANVTCPTCLKILKEKTRML